MKIASVTAGLLLSLFSASVLADPYKDESGHGSRGRAASYAEADREYWKHREERAREARKRREELAHEQWKREEELFREQRKREEEWFRDKHKRALEWERDHAHHSYPLYEPYIAYPAYPPEGITISTDGISVSVDLTSREFSHAVPDG